ncbi:MAG: SDR family NAD(P)-dependent oxidoreductase [Myxococcota bacterium]
MPLNDHPILGITPFEHPDAPLAAALCRAGALGILDLGRDARAAREALAVLARDAGGDFGVRISEGADTTPADLPGEATVVVLPAGVDADPWSDRTVLVEVRSLAEALAAEEAGAEGLVLQGHEGAGRVGEESAFVLLQRVADRVDLPLWVRGGIGLHTAAACRAGGATGVVLDDQLALLRESTAPESVKAALRTMDGSETVLLAGHRVYTRPDLPAAKMGDADEATVRDAVGGTDLRTRLVPVGQAAASARRLAERFRTVAGLVHSLEEAVGAHLRQARATKPLAPGSPFADAHDLEFPLVQGPMTRVSDQAAFAEAVADGGGLPFLALALLRGPKVRELLKETRERLGDRPWGVGILGFVPPDLRDEQLEAIREASPPVALIAGGRPSQARPLEKEGIATYLHVPSPGLLDIFLKEGARRFIFEGRECGGHVGPRTSFALWEEQIERLLAFDAPEELHLLFAGGIHDARSAAMVSAMTAPLAARGAKIGVLMGSAYVFTREAVESGAILESFQEEALKCEDTVLVETAPGHATRCVESGFVRAFREERDRLEAEGLPAKEVWARLEELNLGRLRIASKGLRRDGDHLVDVDEATRRDEGMYMIGQVAALRDRVVTIDELHRDVSEGSVERLEGLEAPERPEPTLPPVDVAIVGMSCVFPGAEDLETFWDNVVDGVDSVGEVPRERWDPDVYYDPDARGGEKSHSKWGGFLPWIPFDPLTYGIPPRSLTAVEPIQLLALEMARRALAHAGYEERPFPRERTSCILGAEAGTDLAGAYGFRAVWPTYCGEMPEALDEALPKLTEDSFPGVLANVIAGRIANRLDLGGANYTVDAACASSLMAVDLAIKELVGGTSDMVLCGGADLHNSINDYLMFSSTHALSRTGRCRTFDSSADGTVLGEGVALVVLKRLADAERDGDTVYGVIKGSAASSDGRSLGLTAPRKEGQQRAVDRAYRRAGTSADRIGLVEAHGTGTIVGDRTELATLTEIYTEAGVPAGSVSLGSVKSQIGHTKCAAGLAGLIKCTLALYHRVRPPTLHVKEPNPFWDPKRSPFVFDGASRPWPGRERAAGVSAFGFGGTNVHMVVSEPPGPTPRAGRNRWPAELFLFRGEDRDQAAKQIERVKALLERDEPWRLRDLARSVSTSGEAPVQVAVVARDLDDLRERIARAETFTSDPPHVVVADAEADRGKVAFLFPGQGSQRPGMMGDLFLSFPWLQAWLERGARWADVMFPPTAFDKETRKAQQAAITDTRVAQPTLGMADMAAADLLRRLGVRPDVLGGHSYGELVALCAAGALDADELLELSEARGVCILDAAGDDAGTMAAVRASAERVEEIVGDVEGVVLANHNGPKQTVISGPTMAVEEAVALLKAADVSARPIPVACAFHSGVVAGARETFAARLEDATVRSPERPVWSNTTAEAHPEDPDGVRRLLADHVVNPVRFVEQVEAMYEAGARTFVEVGPGRVLTKQVGKILGDRPHTAVHLEEGTGSGLEHLQLALARLAVLGVPLDAHVLFEGRDARVMDLRDPPSVKPSASTWLVNGHRAKPLHGEEPPNSLVPLDGPVVDVTRGVGSAQQPAGERDGVMVEYLQTMRKVVDDQREVMLRYLGQPPEQVAQASATDATVLEAEPAGADVAEEAPAEAPEEDLPVVDVLLEIVSERTGYPTEMLALDLDLEGDLSIDSIKRIEILGALAERLGMGGEESGDLDEVIEELAAVKTLGGIVEWLENQESDDSGGGAPGGEGEAAPEEETPMEAPAAIARYHVVVEDAPSPDTTPGALSGHVVALAGDGPVAEALTEALRDRGAEVRAVSEPGDVGEVDALVHLALGGGDDAEHPAKVLFGLVRAALDGGATRLVSVTGLGGTFGRGLNGHGPLPRAGVSGLLKSVAKERPDVHVRIVDVDPTEEAAALADRIEAELGAEDDLLEVGWQGDRRRRLAVVSAEHDGDSPGALDLGDGAVVLLTGGARGITARMAIAMARRSACTIELVGRSPLPEGDEDPAYGEAEDLPALRKLLATRGEHGSPREVEAAARRILREREMRATLEALREAGAEVRYHPVDVRDAEAFGALLDRIYEERGRLDAVIHGAGVLDDGLLEQKTPESFSRVFDTKVAGASTLAERLRSDVRLVVFFGSVSGAFGNKGQVDYAAANDAMDKLAHGLSSRVDGRVVSIDWGPWGGGGMVSPELEREYARRGIGLIDPDGGVAAFLDEIDRPEGEAQVILMRATPQSLS